MSVEPADLKCFQFDFHLDVLFLIRMLFPTAMNDDEILIKFWSFELILMHYALFALSKTIYQLNVVVAPTASFARNNRNAIFTGEHCARATAPAAFQFEAK